MLTGRGGVNGANNGQLYPFIGAIATKSHRSAQAGMPANVAVPYASSIGLRPGYFGGHYLGNQYNPFETDGDPNQPKFSVKNLQVPKGLTLDRLENRRDLLAHFRPLAA